MKNKILNQIWTTDMLSFAFWKRLILQKKVAVSGGLLIMATLCANFLNFIGNMYLSRSQLITFQELSTVGLIAAIAAVSDVFFSAVNKTVMYKTALLYGKSNRIIKTFWEMAYKFSFLFGLSVSIIWVLSVPWISKVFGADMLPLFLSAPAWFLGIILVLNSGFLTGAHKFKTLGILLIGEAFTKLLVTVVLVELGYIYLIYLAYPLSLFVSCVVGSIYIYQLRSTAEETDTVQAKKIPTGFFLSSMGLRVASVLFIGVDVLLAKHLLSDEMAGQYVLLSTAGKMVYLFGSLFKTFITPLVGKNVGASKSSHRIFSILLGLTVVANVIPVIIIGIYGSITIPFIFSNKGEFIVPYILSYTSSMAALSVANIVANYHQAKGNHSLIVVSIVFALIQNAAIYFSSRTLDTMVFVVLCFSLAYAGTLIVLHWLFEKKFIRSL